MDIYGMNGIDLTGRGPRGWHMNQAPVVLCWLIQGSFFLFFNVLVTSQGGGVLAAG
ncbi:Hypothetical predicted protein [Olea europaea subsp. europaea]|uniref:Uncharacterized protein n=1 Tax=Olea europaea subsp. europaea TaxID=158383 RepID=A0A8S0RNV1_OLEEU|nr:Hypothetical predicted protein [Olea europaea subsp. europaea]